MTDQFRAESCKSFGGSTEIFFRNQEDARRHFVFMGDEGSILIESETLWGIFLSQDIVNVFIDNNKDPSIIWKVLRILYKNPETKTSNDFIVGEITPQCADEILSKQAKKFEFKRK